MLYKKLKIVKIFQKMQHALQFNDNVHVYTPVILRCVIPLCWFNNKEFCVLHVQSNTTIIHLLVQQKYNYMFRPYMWAIFRLRFNLQISYTRCVRRLGGCGERYLVVPTVGTVTPGCYKWICSGCLCAHSYAKSML